MAVAVLGPCHEAPRSLRASYFDLKTGRPDRQPTRPARRFPFSGRLAGQGPDLRSVVSQDPVSDPDLCSPRAVQAGASP